eukprot:symbB.v1.2.023483.t1/scaffold2151.1/size87873/2
MVKDIFGRDRYHCVISGCNCAEFQSEAQRDIAQAEDAGIDMEEMESRYHSMTCQAKSMYQLTCICGHDANEHSQQRIDGPKKASGGNGETEIFLDVPGEWVPLHGLCLRKDGPNPRIPQMKSFSST